MSFKPYFFAVAACMFALTALAPATGFARDDHRRDQQNYQGHWKHGQDNRSKNHGTRHYYQPNYQSRIVYRTVPQHHHVHYYNSHAYPRQVFVGQRLVRYEPVPLYAQHRLNPAPYGYYYAAAGPDVLLVSQQDNVIVQILELLLN